MNNAKNFILAVITFLFLSFDSLALSHSTTFDDRPICEKNKGIWREFGNSCAGDCEHIFNEYDICPNAITFSCDCGQGRCWLDNKCIAIADFKKSFDEKAKKEEAENEEKRKKREDEIKNNPELRAYLYDIYKLNQQNNAGQPTANNGVNQASQDQANKLNQQQNNVPSIPMPQIATQPTNQPAIIAQTPNQESPVQRTVPPAFLEKEKQQKEAAAKQKLNQPEGITPLLQDPKTGETIQLPVVPLPQ